MAIHQPLEIQYWLQNVLSGSPTIFLFIMLAFITYLSARMRMEVSTYTVFLVMFGAIMLTTGSQGLIVLITIVAGPILFWIIRRYTE